MKEPTDRTCIEDMSVGQVLALARLVRHALKKQKRSNEQSTFVPEPGKRHAGEYVVQQYEKLYDLLLDAAGATAQDLEDGGQPNRRPQPKEQGDG
jgi:hypothetical protein